MRDLYSLLGENLLSARPFFLVLYITRNDIFFLILIFVLSSSHSNLALAIAFSPIRFFDCDKNFITIKLLTLLRVSWFIFNTKRIWHDVLIGRSGAELAHEVINIFIPLKAVQENSPKCCLSSVVFRNNAIPPDSAITF